MYYLLADTDIHRVVRLLVMYVHVYFTHGSLSRKVEIAIAAFKKDHCVVV